MRTMTLDEYHTALKAQGTKKGVEVCSVCPMCGTVQNGLDLIEAGAGKTFDDIGRFIAFSCVGRWTNAGPPPSKEKKGTQVGCDWTLGGLFTVHELEVVTPDGEHHPRFMPASVEEAQDHLRKQRERRETSNDADVYPREGDEERREVPRGRAGR